MTRVNDPPGVPPEPADGHARSDDPSMTTALSTLTARVAVLERWMRRSQSRERILVAAVVVTLLACLALALR